MANNGPKMPRPFWRESRKCYYVQIDGKQVKLSPAKSTALKMYYHLMATSGRKDGVSAARITVAQAVERIIKEKSATHRENTIDLYVYNLTPFAVEFADRRLSSITSDECVGFVKKFSGRSYKNKPFMESSKALMFRYLKTLFRWARETGLVDLNPLHSTENPWIIATRTRPMTTEEYEAVMADGQTSDELKEFLEFLWRTGARPGEIAVVQARHLDARRNIIRLQPAEYKTGRRTGLPREIIVPSDLMEKLRGYARLKPQGLLFRTNTGSPWYCHVISSAFARTRRRLSLPSDLVIYMARHAFVTRKIKETNGNLGLVAKLVGHVGTTTIQKVYYHPDLDDMDAIVNAGSESEVARITEIRSRKDPATPPATDSNNP